MERKTYDKLKKALTSSDVCNEPIQMGRFFDDVHHSTTLENKLEFLEMVTGVDIVKVAGDRYYFKTSDRIVDRTGNGYYERTDVLASRGFVLREGKWVHDMSDYGDANFYALDPYNRERSIPERCYSYNPT